MLPIHSEFPHTGLTSVSFLVAALMFVTLLSFSTSPVSAEGIGSWSFGTSYPTAIHDQSCVSYLANIVCVGGDNGTGVGSSNVYYINNQSVLFGGSWSNGTNYPVEVKQETCVAALGYIYCIGGGKTGPSGETYYAPITSAGVGDWSATTPYPLNTSHLACVSSLGYAFCAGGGTNKTYFAALSSSGIGAWTQTTSYPFPVSLLSCVTSSGYIYCVDGINSESNQTTNAAYFARVSPSGIGTWFVTTSYPLELVQTACVAYSEDLYCVGGNGVPKNTLNMSSDVFYASLSSSEGGLGNWQATTSFPDQIFGTNCVVASIFIYCIAGGGGTFSTTAVYDAQFLSPSSTSIVCSENTVSQGSTISCTATVVGNNPFGSVGWISNGSSYTLSSPSCTLSSGSCSITFTDYTPGHALLIATYGGDSTNAPSNGTIILDVIGVTTSISATTTSSSLISTTQIPTTENTPSVFGLIAPPLAAISLIVIIVLLVTALWRRYA